MLIAPRPTDEEARLNALRALLLLDTPPEDRFDRIVAFAAEELDMPIALISLVDEHRQWFKSRVGLDAAETARDISFCGHAITQPATFVVDDALRDDRFRDNPLVTGGPEIRFYAGAPLRLPSGHAVGTLCVLDTRPRTLDRVDHALLAALRDLIVEEIAKHEAGP